MFEDGERASMKKYLNLASLGLRGPLLVPQLNEKMRFYELSEADQARLR